MGPASGPPTWWGQRPPAVRSLSSGTIHIDSTIPPSHWGGVQPASATIGGLLGKIVQSTCPAERTPDAPLPRRVLSRSF